MFPVLCLDAEPFNLSSSTVRASGGSLCCWLHDKGPSDSVTLQSLGELSARTEVLQHLFWGVAAAATAPSARRVAERLRRVGLALQQGAEVLLPFAVERHLRSHHPCRDLVGVRTPYAMALADAHPQCILPRPRFQHKSMCSSRDRGPALTQLPCRAASGEYLPLAQTVNSASDASAGGTQH